MSAIPTPDPNDPAWNKYVINQSFNATDLSGNSTEVSFTDLNQIAYENTVQAIFFAFGFGFAMMLLLILLVITPSKQRRQPIYILNVISLSGYSVRALMTLIINCAPYNAVSVSYFGAIAGWNNDTWTPLVIQAIAMMVYYVTMSVSLLLQVRVVFAAEPKTQKLVTFGFGAVCFGFCVLCWVSFINRLVWQFSATAELWTQLQNPLEIYFIIYLGICCLAFLYKLGGTILRRRRMGIDVTHFGPLQIIFVMFLQCLIVPLILVVIQYTINPGDNFTGLAHVFLLVSLPLSSLWASTDANKPRSAISQISVSSSDRESERSKGRYSGWSKEKKPNKGSVTSDYTDLEKAPSYTTDHAPAASSSEELEVR